MSKQERYAGASALQGLSLGQQSAYISQYTPSLLQPVPRSLNRDDLGLGETLPFQGCDVWTLYELSWLNAKGKPVVALGEVAVPATSPNLIESKSFKLYLNSFNQTRLAGVDELVATLTRDLSAAAGAPVLVHVAPLSTRPQRPMGYPKGILLDGLEIDVDLYTPEPALLSADTSRAPVTETLYSHLLKSNCLVTGQPDWAMLVVRYTGAPIDREGLLRYIISFRQHNEFHEQCVERVFVDILRQCQPSAL